MTDLPINWRHSSSNKGGIFCMIKTESFVQSFDFIEKIKPIVLGYENNHHHIGIDLNAGILNVMMDNYENEDQVSTEEFIKIANLINQKLNIQKDYNEFRLR
jgi:hypothetical protein